MKKRKYDLIFSLGEACFMASALRKNKLRFFSCPFDWMYGSNFKGRCKILATKFENFFNKDDLHFSYYRDFNKMKAYYNKRNDLTFNHDFHTYLPFDYEYIKTKEKYERRIKRLLDKISKSKKVLIIYGDLANTERGCHSDEEIKACMDEINKTFAPTKFDLLYIKHNPTMKDKEVSYCLKEENIIIAECCSQNLQIDDVAGNNKNLKTALSFISKYPLKSYLKTLCKSAYKIIKDKNKIRIRLLGIPIKNIKRKLIIEYCKKKYVLENKKDLQIAVFGSSHGNRGLNSMFMQRPTINLATTSQDLYQSFHLCKKVVNDYPEIRTVLLFYAPFSQGYNISCSSEKYRAAYMDVIFSIPPFQKDKSILRYYKEKYKSYLKYDSKDLYSDNNPLFEDDREIEDETIISKRAKKHMSFAKDSSMNKYLISLIDLLKEKNINLYVIIPPFIDLYKRYIDEDIAFTEVKKICKDNNVTLLSFYNDIDFNNEDFCNCDHLNVLGAIKLTKKINDILENNNETI